MVRLREQILHRRLFDDLAGIHHHDALRGLGHHAHVVGDQHHRHAEARLHVEQQVEDLRLDGDVQRGGRLVGDQQLRLAGERHGDHHALAHAAGELVRVVAHAAVGIGDLHQPQHVHRGIRRCLARAALDARRSELGDLLAHA